jgi:hypothetical protein
MGLVTRIEQGSTRLSISSCEKTLWRHFWTYGDEIRQNLVEIMGKETLPKSGKFEGRLWNRARRECLKCLNR